MKEQLEKIERELLASFDPKLEWARSVAGMAGGVSHLAGSVKAQQLLTAGHLNLILFRLEEAKQKVQLLAELHEIELVEHGNN